MRGVPNNPVPCRGEGCKSPYGAPSDGLCVGCRSKGKPNGRHKYFFTPDHDERLRKIYAEHAGNRWTMAKAKRALARLTGFPLRIINQQASRLGLCVDRRNFWTDEETAMLEELAGTKSTRELCRILSRGYHSVAFKVEQLRLSRTVTEGYSIGQLKLVMGLSHDRVTMCIQRGWLTLDRETKRITESSVRHFIRRHPEQYSLKRVDEAWFKGILFPGFGMGVPENEKRQSAPRYSIESAIAVEDREERAMA